jgi:glutaredoxin-like protein
LLSLKVYDFQDNQDLARQYQIDCAPAITFLAVDGDQKIDHGIRYLGVPSGNEFTTLINDLMLVSTRDSALKPEVVEYLQNLKTPVHLQVFVTPTCPYCPRAVMSAHQLAFETSMIQAEAVDAWEFQEKVGQFGVSGVPHTVINQGKGNLVGSAGVEDLLAEIRRVVDGVGEGA